MRMAHKDSLYWILVVIASIILSVIVFGIAYGLGVLALGSNAVFTLKQLAGFIALYVGYDSLISKIKEG